MAKSGRIQRVVLGMLMVMLVASLLLAVMAFARPARAHAQHPVQPRTHCWWYFTGVYSCDYGTHQYFEYWCYRCCNHPDLPPGCHDLYCEWRDRGWPGQCQ